MNYKETIQGLSEKNAVIDSLREQVATLTKERAESSAALDRALDEVQDFSDHLSEEGGYDKRDVRKRYADPSAILAAHDAEKDEQIAELAAALVEYRKVIHRLDKHNQHFERCESAWCHPGADTPWALASAILAAHVEAGCKPLVEALEDSKSSVIEAMQESREEQSATLRTCMKRIDKSLADYERRKGTS